MKKIYLIITILFVGLYSCKAQLNELTQTEYYEIKINNVTFRSIYDTNADLTKMMALFGNDILYKFENDILIRKEFWKPGLYYFNFNSDMGNDYFLTVFKIRSSLVSVTVKGVTAKLGDDKSVFANNIAINTHVGSNNTIAFIDKLTGSALLIFKIDEISNKIIEITFNVF